MYTLYNFVPLCLLNQFRRITNFYFLAICLSQFVPLIRVWDPITGLIPLLWVVGMGMMREAVEDFYRFLEDRKINSTPVSVIRQGQEIKIRSD